MVPTIDYFVSWIGDDGPEVSWFVQATKEEAAEIEAWLQRNHPDDMPVICPIVMDTFEEFKRDTMDPEDADREENDA